MQTKLKYTRSICDIRKISIRCHGAQRSRIQNYSFSVTIIYLLGMSVLCEYAIAAYFAYCHIFRIFQQSAHTAYFPAQIGISTAILILFVFLLPISTSVSLPQPSGCQQNGTIHVSGPPWNDMG